MKTQTAILAGLTIACTVVILTRKACIGPRNDNGQTESPSIRIFPAEQTSPPVTAPADNLPAKNDPYPVIVLSGSLRSYLYASLGLELKRRLKSRPWV